MTAKLLAPRRCHGKYPTVADVAERHRQRSSNLTAMYRCAVCGETNAATRKSGWCRTCEINYASWKTAWRQLGVPAMCPDDLLELRIAYYRSRAELGLDLFEPPLSGSIRD